MTRGKPVVRVGVIHPIESYWLRFGPKEQTAAIREEMNDQFMQLADWLLFNLIDYNYICEANLPAQANGTTKVGCMQYDTIIVPNLLTVRGTTLDFLKNFKANGGKVIFAGSLPEYVDAVESNDAKAFAAELGVNVQFQIIDWDSKVMELDGKTIELDVSSSNYYSYEIGDEFIIEYRRGAFNEPFYISS